MSKKNEEEKPTTRNLHAELLFPLKSNLLKLATGEVHVSVVKEQMMRVWSTASEEERKLIAKDFHEGMTRLSMSLESLKQEVTIATVKQRTEI